MKRNPYYTIKSIGDETYLVPFGQAIEDLAHAVCLNDVAAFLWEELEYSSDVNVLAKRLADEYEVEPEERGQLEADVVELLQNLKDNELVIDETAIEGEDGPSGRNGPQTNRVTALNTWGQLRMGGMSNENSGLQFRAGRVRDQDVGDQERIYKEGNEDRGRLIRRKLEIAGIKICICGRSDYFSENFEAFYVDGERCVSDGFDENYILNNEILRCRKLEGDRAADLYVYVTEEEPPAVSDKTLVLKGMSVSIYERGDFYDMWSVEMPMLRKARISKDGSLAIFYMDPSLRDAVFIPWAINNMVGINKTVLEGVVRDNISEKELAVGGEAFSLTDSITKEESLNSKECVFHATRQAFLIKAQKMGMYVIHSVSILHEGKAWLFSAPSGTGKSTHANIWNKLWGTPSLNGDLNLLAFEGEKPVVKGIPWCGTSGIFTTQTYPLGGIILLVRDMENYMEELSLDVQILGVQMRFITSKLTVEQVSESLDFAARIAETARIVRLHCNMEDEAAEVCRAWVEKD